MDERSEIYQKVKKRAQKETSGDTGMLDLPEGRIGKKDSVYCSDPHLIMVALCNRADHYIFALWLVSSFFSSPTLSGCRLDVYHTSTHGVALVRI